LSFKELLSSGLWIYTSQVSLDVEISVAHAQIRSWPPMQVSRNAAHDIVKVQILLILPGWVLYRQHGPVHERVNLLHWGHMCTGRTLTACHW
jgi:hypothetical protein